MWHFCCCSSVGTKNVCWSLTPYVDKPYQCVPVSYHTNVSPKQCITISMYHHIHVLPYQCIIISMYYHTDVSPYQCITLSMYHHINISPPYHHASTVTIPPCHHITTSPRHHTTTMHPLSPYLSPLSPSLVQSLLITPSPTDHPIPP